MSKRGRFKKKSVAVYGSDDERAYENEAIPDPKSREFVYDDVDEFHLNRDKILLDKGSKDQRDELSSGDELEEVLPVGSSSDDEDDFYQYRRQLRRIKASNKKEDMDSDLDETTEYRLPDSKAWGTRRSKYYGGDVAGSDVELSGSDDEDTAAVLEEKEALALQRKLAEQMEEDDFGLDLFQTTKPAAEEIASKEEKITQDLSQLSQKEKMQLLQKESPELLPLIDEFKEKLTEVRDVLQPLFRLVSEGRISGRKEADYINTKLQLYLNYCTNISFYFVLKSNHTSVHNHPVVKRLVQYRNLIKQLEPVDQRLQPEISELIRRLNSGEDVKLAGNLNMPEKLKRHEVVNNAKRKLSASESENSSSEEEQMKKDKVNVFQRKKSKKTDSRYETVDEKKALDYYDMMKGGRKPGGDEDMKDRLSAEDDIEDEHAEENDELRDEGGEKRAITYQIEKNKGLVPHRKKELRNPRVKYKMKYRKAIIRRKGQVREPRKEITRYGGELSGIRAGIKRGIRLK